MMEVILPVFEFTCNKDFEHISEIADVAGHGVFHAFQIINLHLGYFWISSVEAVSNRNDPDVEKLFGDINIIS